MGNSKPTSKSGLLITHALIWAGVMLGLAYIYRENGAVGDDLLIILVGLFTISSGFLIRAGRK